MLRRRARRGLRWFRILCGDVGDLCEGTGKKNDLQYSLDRKRITGDLHGEAQLFWAASAMLR